MLCVFNYIRFAQKQNCESRKIDYEFKKMIDAFERRIPSPEASNDSYNECKKYYVVYGKGN